MHSARLKKSIASTAFLALSGLAGTASAHTLVGLSLGTAAGATDYYQVSCGTGTVKLQAHVKDTSANDAVKISVQVHKGFVTGNSTDSTGGDGTYSPWLSISQSSGVYDVFINKNAAKAQGYDIEMHCMNSSGGEVDPAIIRRQNQ